MQITGQEKPNNNVFILAGQQWAVGTGGRPGRAGQESRPREPASHLDLTTHCDIAASDVLCVSNVPYSTAARRHIYATAAAGSSSDEKTAGTKQPVKRD